MHGTQDTAQMERRMNDLENEMNDQAAQLTRIRRLLGQYLEDRDPYYAIDQILTTMGMQPCSGRTKTSK